MLTEQEVIAQLNEKLAKKTIKADTAKYTNKLKELETLLNDHQKEMDNLKGKMKKTRAEIQKIRGAISILLELAAESEGLIKP